MILQYIVFTVFNISSNFFSLSVVIQTSFSPFVSHSFGANANRERWRFYRLKTCHLPSPIYILHFHVPVESVWHKYSSFYANHSQYVLNDAPLGLLALRRSRHSISPIRMALSLDVFIYVHMYNWAGACTSKGVNDAWSKKKSLTTTLHSLF